MEYRFVVLLNELRVVDEEKLLLRSLRIRYLPPRRLEEGNTVRLSNCY